MRSLRAKIVLLFVPLFLAAFFGFTAVLDGVIAESIRSEAMNAIWGQRPSKAASKRSGPPWRRWPRCRRFTIRPCR